MLLLDRRGFIQESIWYAAAQENELQVLKSTPVQTFAFYQSTLMPNVGAMNIINRYFKK